MVGIEQDNTTVNVKVNEVLRIELPGNAGTGFQWRFDELDEVYFILMDSDTKIPEKTNPNFVGNSYQKSWRIKAVRSGSSAIRLLYYRSWEGKDMAEKEFNIKVVVKPE